MSHPPNSDQNQSDVALLRAFLGDGDESAFAELVSRYAGLVYGVALRRAGRAVADEVVQNTFTKLAHKARSIDASRGLAAWLHKVAEGEAANAARKELRRNRAMERYAESLGETESGGAVDADLVPVLDEALVALRDTDRQVVLMRFFESLSFREIGQRIGTTEEAGRKRVSRALDKLSSLVQRRTGRAVSAGALATSLGVALQTKAPAAVVAAAASTSAAAVSGSSIALLSTIMKTSQVAFVSTLLIAAAIPMAVQWQASARPETAVAPSSAVESPRPDGNLDDAGSSEPAPQDGIDLAQLEKDLARIDRNGEPKELTLRLAKQMFALREDEVPEVGDVLAKWSNTTKIHRIVNAYFARWAEFAPLAAIEETKSPRWGQPNGNLAQTTAARVWAASDPDAAVEWCEAQEDDGHGRILKYCVFQNWMVADPSAAMAKTAELPDQRKRSYRKSLLSEWVHHDAPGALGWAIDVEDEVERSAMVESVIESSSQKDAAAGFELARSLEDPILRKDGIRYALMQWRFTPEEAVRGYLDLGEVDRSDDLAGEMLRWIGIKPRRDRGHEELLGDWLDERGEGREQR